MIPGGFGSRGFEGKIAAARFAREEGMPCLGLCLGLHAMVSEFARNVLGMTGANSSEMDPTTKYPVIDLMHDQRDVTDMGGTMRLGAYYAVLEPGSKVAAAYGEPVVSERHRHRYEVNPKFRARFEEAGLVSSGTSPDRRLVEFIELSDHPVLGRDPGPSRVQEPARSSPPPVPRADRRGTDPARRDSTRPAPHARRGRNRHAGRRAGVERRRVLTHGGLPSPRRNRGPPRPHLACGRRRLRGARRHTVRARHRAFTGCGRCRSASPSTRRAGRW